MKKTDTIIILLLTLKYIAPKHNNGKGLSRNDLLDILFCDYDIDICEKTLVRYLDNLQKLISIKITQMGYRYYYVIEDDIVKLIR